MKTYCYHLRFSGPVHFGDTGIGMENAKLTLPSDGVTSAVVNALAVLNAADEAATSLLSESPPFVFSSLFPFGPSKESRETCYALPRPLSPPPVEHGDVLRNLGKEIKRVAFLDPQGFADWVGDKPLGLGRLSEMVQTAKALAAEWDPEAKFGWYAKELRPRVSLDRATSASAIWHCGAFRFHRDAGLYGLVRVADDVRRERLDAAFRVLGDMGLGGERTYGMGHFTFSGFTPLEATIPRLSGLASKKYVLLSNFFPKPNERAGFHSLMDSWDFFETRGYVVSGRLATKIKRKRVRMVVCGSVARQPIRGAMVDVTPDQAPALGLKHRVYRSGLAFTVPEGGTE